MPTPLTTISPVSHTQQDVRTDPRASGSSPFVMVKDLKTPTTDPNDPYEALANLNADSSNSIICNNTANYPWLETMPVISGGTLPAADIIVRFFGLIRMPKVPDPSANRLMPFDVDSTKYNYLRVGDDGYEYFCVPLRELGASAYSFTTFDHSSNILDNDDGDVTNQLLPPKVLYCAGFDAVLALVDTESDVDGCLVGHFTN